ncbi:GTP-binding protein Rhes,Ras-related protein Rap-1,GTP-binding protein drn-1,GTP-binding protein Di-Ras2 [Mytilus edulis]|uniref:GTP-binding protein Rhes,Ras-related protein Rap-1,GTP-binding protein drn-1,GTP-binding protein Di-Ras2 n=1 Tax=Mytilus edulis TaxID=6550 RepID=A0A8S3S1X7_MYTED|nr:GTP-binding protein Rhes,Ras-related protein Rap-1,GTP-binding protein drn-1,GTP-binding protein Di-Ras2 [Mytilus edulis]
MVDVDQRNRVVFLGAGGVGKSSVLQRFLFGTYNEKYKETIEDLFAKEYDICGTHLKVDFLDTAGNIAFPAMRRLSIVNAHGFVLVYSITNEKTFEEVKQLWEQIKEARENYQEIPCVIVGNHLDEENNRQVERFDALNWAYNEDLGGGFIEVSAKEDTGISDIFKLLLGQVKTPRAKHTERFMLRRMSVHSLECPEPETTPPEDIQAEDKSKFSRSRSLIRRGSKLKMKRSSRSKGDCAVS